MKIQSVRKKNKNILEQSKKIIHEEEDLELEKINKNTSISDIVKSNNVTKKTFLFAYNSLLKKDRIMENFSTSQLKIKLKYLEREMKRTVEKIKELEIKPIKNKIVFDENGEPLRIKESSSENSKNEYEENYEFSDQEEYIEQVENKIKTQKKDETDEFRHYLNELSIFRKNLIIQIERFQKNKK